MLDRYKKVQETQTKTNITHLIITFAFKISGDAGDVVVQRKSLTFLGNAEGGLEAGFWHGTSPDAIASAVLAAGWLRSCLAVAAIAVG